MTIRKTVLVGLALALLGAVSASAARGDDYNQKTVLTFSQPFELPGRVLPAGTYTFQLLDTISNRHIVQVSNHDGTEHIGYVMTIASSRLTPTEQTIMTFSEVPVGDPEAVRTWFYPGRLDGHEFVYPRRRALELAAASNVRVPAIAVDVADPDLKTVPIVVVTPDRREEPVAVARTPMPERTTALATLPSTQSGRQLPQTASPLFLIALLGIGSFGLGAAALLFNRKLHRLPAPVSVR